MQINIASTLQTHPSSFFDHTTVLIPAFNESRFIGSVVLQARRYAATVIVVDDGSKDDTAEVAEAAGAIVLRQETNAGKGKAISTGFDYIRKNVTTEVVVMVDGDGQHRCAEIPTMVQPIIEGHADLVVGSRFLEKKSDIPAWRIFGQQALNIATNFSSRANLSDSQSGFRAFSRKILDQFPFDTEGFSVESEMQFVIQRAGLRVVEVPISVIYEEPAKRNPIMQGLQVLNGIIRLVSTYRPLFFFGGGGFLILLIGFFWGGYVVDIYRRTQTLAVGYALISVLLTIMGSSALFTGLMLHSVTGLMKDIKKSINRLQKK